MSERILEEVLQGVYPFLELAIVDLLVSEDIRDLIFVDGRFSPDMGIHDPINLLETRFTMSLQMGRGMLLSWFRLLMSAWLRRRLGMFILVC